MPSSAFYFMVFKFEVPRHTQSSLQCILSSLKFCSYPSFYLPMHFPKFIVPSTYLFNSTSSALLKVQSLYSCPSQVHLFYLNNSFNTFIKFIYYLLKLFSCLSQVYLFILLIELVYFNFFSILRLIYFIYLLSSFISEFIYFHVCFKFIYVTEAERSLLNR